MTDDATDTARKELATVRVAAMNLLARREHSRQELVSKLSAKFPEHDGLCHRIDRVLDRLECEGLLSDARFAEAFLRNRARKGQGPYRIRQELQQRGVAQDLVEKTFAENVFDWFELARQVAEKRFGTRSSNDYRVRSKRARFLQYRGFDTDQIQYALDDRQEH